MSTTVLPPSKNPGESSFLDSNLGTIQTADVTTPIPLTENGHLTPRRSEKPRCILHVGTHKTGTSSIQESLYFGLEDPKFRYINLGFLQAAFFLAPCILDHPEDYWVFQSIGYSRSRIWVMRRAYECRLRRSLRIAKEKALIPILSAELCWTLPPSALNRLRHLIASEGFEVKVIVYLRPIKSWMESAFQQTNKFRRTAFLPYQTPPTLSPEAPYRYSRKLAIIEDVFGRENLMVRPFVRPILDSGCVVRDFCRIAGIQLPLESIRRSNESLSAEATRALYVHHHFSRKASRISLASRSRILKTLKTLEGPPIRFHSSIFDPVADLMAFETEWVGHHFGIDLSEDITAADGGPCIQQEADLFRFSKETLDWLGRASGTARVREQEGESAARAVALQMDRLFQRPLIHERWELLREKIHTRLRWISKGD